LNGNFVKIIHPKPIIYTLRKARIKTV